MAPGGLVRWIGEGVESCGWQGQKWLPIEGSCWYPIDLLTPEGPLEIFRVGRWTPGGDDHLGGGLSLQGAADHAGGRLAGESVARGSGAGEGRAEDGSPPSGAGGVHADSPFRSSRRSSRCRPAVALAIGDSSTINRAVPTPVPTTPPTKVCRYWRWRTEWWPWPTTSFFQESQCLSRSR